MKKVKYTIRKEDEFFIGYLNDYPEYETQAFGEDEILENLNSLLEDIESNKIPFIKKLTDK